VWEALEVRSPVEIGTPLALQKLTVMAISVTSGVSGVRLASFAIAYPMWQAELSSAAEAMPAGGTLWHCPASATAIAAVSNNIAAG